MDRGDVVRFARIVETAVFSSMLCAEREPEKESFWRKHADKLEQKFTEYLGSLTDTPAPGAGSAPVGVDGALLALDALDAALSDWSDDMKDRAFSSLSDGIDKVRVELKGAKR